MSIVVHLSLSTYRYEVMTETHLQKVRSLRQQIITETKHGFADWNLVQNLLDELISNHRQYKHLALKENIDLYQ
jgi:hypothetical protein